MFPKKEREGPEATRGNERFYHHNNQFLTALKERNNYGKSSIAVCLETAQTESERQGKQS